SQWIVRIAILLIITVSPWWYASVSQSARLFLFACGTLALAATWVYLLSTYLNRRGSNEPHKNETPTRFLPWLTVPVVLGLGFLIFQTLPLNDSLTQYLAPHQAELYQQYSSPVAEEAMLSFTENNAQNPRISISMDPQETNRYAILLFFALGVMFCSYLFFNCKKAILLFLLVVTVNAVAISGWGFVQKASHDTSLSTQQVRDGVLSFGPFVNKNNAAGFLLMGLACAIGLLAYQYRGRRKTHADNKQMIGHRLTLDKKILFNVRVFISDLDARRLATIVAVLIIAAGIITCASRGAFIGLLIGIFSAATFYSIKYRSFTAILVIAITAAGVILLVQFIGVGETASRQFSTLSDADLVNTESRISHWRENSSAISEFSPLGSGVGSYLNIHRMNRNGVETRVWYFAENQYFQTLVEAGIPGLLLLLMALYFLWTAWNRIATNQEGNKLIPCMGVMGAVLIPSQMVAAFFDFGLFIPSNTLLMAGLCGILVGYANTLKKVDPELAGETNVKLA
ncbi:MAG: O-antigen ligase family protein, partial [Pirellulaceae bacterium]|nr:O-antigen ligase family protein [Pirellulaceae bacterium]